MVLKAKLVLHSKL